MTTAAVPPPVLTIAGSDCSAGAGMQADLKTFGWFGVHGLTAVTCVVAETSRVVGSVHPVPAEIVHEQVVLLLASFPVAAVKTGMLFSRAIIEAVAAALDDHPAPLVVDPVMIASTGDALLEPDAIEAYRRCLLPRAAVITPNLDEAARLAGSKIDDRAGMEEAARRLGAKFGTAVLVKGGHLEGPECADVLVEGGRAYWYAGPRVASAASHGTGCTFSAAIAAALALGRALPAAVGEAKRFLESALGQSHSWVDHDGRAIHALNQSPDR